MVVPGSRLAPSGARADRRRRRPRLEPRPRTTAPTSSASATRSPRPSDSIGLLRLEKRMIEQAKSRPQQRRRPPQARLSLAPPRRSRRAVALRRRRVRVPVGHRSPADLALRAGTGWAWPSTASATRRSRSSPASRPCSARTRSPGRPWRSPSRPRWTPASSRVWWSSSNTALAPAGQHQARRGAGRAPARGLDGRRARPGGAARARPGRARGGRRRLGPRRLPRLSRAGRQPEPGRARGRADAVPAGPLRRGSRPTTRARRRTTRRPSPAYRADLATIASRQRAARVRPRRAGRSGRTICSEFWSDA